MKKSTKDITLFDYEMEHIDSVTGEVTSKTSTKVVKRDKTPDFIMLFTEGAPLLSDASLSKREQNILNEILSTWVGLNNRVDFSQVLRAHLAKVLDYSPSSIYKGLNSLKRKKIFVEKNNITENDVKGAIYLNPNIFGKGHWNDIKKLRYDIQIDFDFETLEATTSSSRTAAYHESEELLPHGKLKEVDREMKAVGSSKEEKIIVEDIELVASEIEIVEKKGSVGLIDNTELEILRERRKILELENKSKELDIKGLEFQIELKKMN